MSRVMGIMVLLALFVLCMADMGLCLYKPCMVTYDVTVNGVSVPGVTEVTPGATFTVALSYKIWSAEEGPGYVWCAVIGIDGDAQKSFYTGIPGLYPGASGSWSGTLTAPSTAGPYGIYVLMEPTTNCSNAISHYENAWIYNWGAIAGLSVAGSQAAESATYGAVKALFK